MEIVLNDTKNPKLRIKILMSGTKNAACHHMMADCDGLAVCSKLVLNFEKYENSCDIGVSLHHFELIYGK